jgi:hypothetical protein
MAGFHAYGIQQKPPENRRGPPQRAAVHLFPIRPRQHLIDASRLLEESGNCYGKGCR